MICIRRFAMRIVKSTTTWKKVHVGDGTVIAPSYPTVDFGPTDELVPQKGEIAVRIVTGSLRSLSHWLVGSPDELLAELTRSGLHSLAADVALLERRCAQNQASGAKGA
jgi:hypothetical protein